MRRHVITGAPGTGKSALVTALASRSVAVVGEPARELIAEHRAATNGASLDHEPELFVARLIDRSIETYDAAAGDLTVYDRGLPDCVAYAMVYGLDTDRAVAAAQTRRYADPVLIAPPWEAIYHTDDMRRATFPQVEAFHEAIVEAYQSLGYRIVELPRMPLAERTQHVADILGIG